MEKAPGAWYTWRVLITQQKITEIVRTDLDYVVQGFHAHAGAQNNTQLGSDTAPINESTDQPCKDIYIRVVTRNIRGLADNLPALVRCRSDINLIQEVDLLEYRVGELRASAMQAGYQLFFGDTVQLGTDSNSAHGRRVAIAIKNQY